MSTLNTLQYYTFFGWIYLRLRDLVISFTAEEDTWYRSDIQDNTVTIMIIIYVFALLLPFCINTSFNTLSNRDFEDDSSVLVFIWSQFRIRKLFIASFEDLRLDNPVLTIPV